MQQLLMMDEKDYNETLEEITRVAVRGIIFDGGKLLVIEDKTGGVKLPGGGQESGEDDLTTLIREVKEETGYTVIPETIRPFGTIEEKRKARHEDKIWHQISRLYFCKTASGQTEQNFTENEKKHGMKLISCTIDEAIEKNRNLLGTSGAQSWNTREYKALLLIKEKLAKK